ncbi:hypothetical protein BJ875DRAFT_461588 [Amylocarpus encephaloides]|uniref:Chromo domain-containing protein n=1 Tax=Amylocarpus encephaloides TaxID=45428 RepID=A0A9P7YJY7_9HELO|nr:hypothetical protein BJ875DRAFT_461588 [Amylocarpus encephaloides]
MGPATRINVTTPRRKQSGSTDTPRTNTPQSETIKNNSESRVSAGFLKKSKIPPKNSKRKYIRQTTPDDPEEGTWLINGIVGERRRKGKIEYEIDWKDHPRTHEIYANTWESESDVNEEAKEDWRRAKEQRKKGKSGDDIQEENTPSRRQSNSHTTSKKRKAESSPPRTVKKLKRASTLDTANLGSSSIVTSSPKGTFEIPDSYEEQESPQDQSPNGKHKVARVLVVELLKPPRGFDPTNYQTVSQTQPTQQAPTSQSQSSPESRFSTQGFSFESAPEATRPSPIRPTSPFKKPSRPRGIFEEDDIEDKGAEIPETQIQSPGLLVSTPSDLATSGTAGPNTSASNSVFQVNPSSPPSRRTLSRGGKSSSESCLPGSSSFEPSSSHLTGHPTAKTQDSIEAGQTFLQSIEEATQGSLISSVGAGKVSRLPKAQVDGPASYRDSSNISSERGSPLPQTAITSSNGLADTGSSIEESCSQQDIDSILDSILDSHSPQAGQFSIIPASTGVNSQRSQVPLCPENSDRASESRRSESPKKESTITETDGGNSIRNSVKISSQEIPRTTTRKSPDLSTSLDSCRAQQSPSAAIVSSTYQKETQDKHNATNRSLVKTATMNESPEPTKNLTLVEVRERAKAKIRERASRMTSSIPEGNSTPAANPILSVPIITPGAITTTDSSTASETPEPASQGLGLRDVPINGHVSVLESHPQSLSTQHISESLSNEISLVSPEPSPPATAMCPELADPPAESLNVPPLGLSEYIVPLILTLTTRDLYLERIKTSKRLRNAFRDDSSNLAVAESIKLLLEELDMLCEHPDLLNEDLSQKEVTQLNQARYAETVSTKCMFLAALILALQNSEMHLLLLSRSGRMQEIVEAILAAYGFRNSAASRTFTQPELPLKISVRSPRDINQEKSGSISAAIAVDSSLTAGQLERIRTKEQGQLAPLISLVVAYSAEHLDLCLDKSITGIDRSLMLIECIRQIRGDVGRLDKGVYENPPEAARLTAAFLTSEFEWPLQNMPSIEYMAFNSFSAFSQSTEVDTPQRLSSSKRQLVEDESWGFESPKRAKLCELADDSELTHVSKNASAKVPSQDSAMNIDEEQNADARLKKIVADYEDKLRSNAARESELRLQNQTLNEKFKELELNISEIIQPKYQDALNDRNRFEQQVDKANKRATFLQEKAETRTADFTKATEAQKKSEEELTTARALLSASTVPEIAELHKARDEIRTLQLKNEKLEKKCKVTEDDQAFIRDQYQTASSQAAEALRQNREYEEEFQTLREKVDENNVRIHEIYHGSEIKQHLQHIEELKAEKEEIRKELDKKTEELKALMNGRRPTRGTSVPRSPRLGTSTMSPRERPIARIFAGGSRGNSPAPSGGEMMQGASVRFGQHLQS